MTTTALQAALRRHLDRIWANSSVREHPFFVEWARKVAGNHPNPEPLTVERLCAVCSVEGSAVTWLQHLKTVVMALRWTEPGPLVQGHHDVVQAAHWMTLVLCERRIARDSALRDAAADAPLIGLTAPAAAALVAAHWLGLTITMKLDGARSPQPVNVLSDMAALEYGFHDAKDALIAELQAFKECWADGRVQTRMDRRALVMNTQADGVVSVEDLRDMLDAHRDDTGLPIVFGLPQGSSAATALRDPALRQWLRDALDVQTYFYGELADPALRKTWGQLQAVIEKSFLEPILQNLHGNEAVNPKDITPMSSPKRTTVFISYAHKDADPWLSVVSEHLGVLENQGLIKQWDDRELDAGDNWRAKIDEALQTCKLALLLISPSFLSSKFVLTKEVPELLERHKSEGLIIYPMLIRDCAWEKVSWLEERQVRPRDAVPVGRNESPLAWDRPMAEMAREVERLCAR